MTKDDWHQQPTGSRIVSVNVTELFATTRVVDILRDPHTPGDLKIPTERAIKIPTGLPTPRDLKILKGLPTPRHLKNPKGPQAPRHLKIPKGLNKPREKIAFVVNIPIKH
ncbi:unnamed protein product [Aphanomyces euteiches]